MSAVIHKHKLDVAAWQQIDASDTARVLHVDEQHSSLCVWVEQPEEPAQRPRMAIWIVPTGGEVPDDVDHVGSVLVEDGHYVWHVYKGRAS